MDLSLPFEQATSDARRYVNRKDQKLNNKLKILGTLLSAALLSGAIAVVSASATAGGHFTSEEVHTVLQGEQEPNGINVLHDAIGSVHCKIAKFSGTTNATTVETVSFTPLYEECTTAGNNKEVAVHVNGCSYTFTARKGQVEQDNTVHLVCPTGQSITLTVFTEANTKTLACTLHIPTQTPTGGVAYKTTGLNATHAITATLTVKEITVVRKPAFFGGCLFAAEHGTTGELTGTANLNGFNTEGKQKGITAT